MTQLPARRLLLVHAHPDDESITTGATMARYVAEGAHVTLVTCTLGEEGEIIPPGLARLAADRDDALGPHRAGELAAAMRALGVTDHRLLGGPGRFRDSGMTGTVQNTRTDAFCRAAVDPAAALLAGVIREVRPQVLVTYDPDGGYGHPDHIQAHRVAMRAAELAAWPADAGGARAGAGGEPDAAGAPDGGPDGTGAPHTIEKIYWNRAPRSVVEAGFAPLAAALARLPFAAAAAPADVPGFVDDAVVTTRIDGTGFAAAKTAAMRAHATQIEVHGAWFALSNGLAQPILPVEYYQRVRGGEYRSPDAGPETDLFEGVPV